MKDPIEPIVHSAATNFEFWPTLNRGSTSSALNASMGCEDAFVEAGNVMQSAPAGVGETLS